MVNKNLNGVLLVASWQKEILLRSAKHLIRARDGVGGAGAGEDRADSRGVREPTMASAFSPCQCIRLAEEIKIQLQALTTLQIIRMAVYI